MKLSYSEESTIARTVEAPSARSRRGDDASLLSFYDVEATSEALATKFADDALGRPGRVALQLPDDLLHDAPRVVKALVGGIARHNARLAAERSVAACPAARLFILGDTSYGERCVDEIAAEHCRADVIVHYGGSILVPTSRIPVVYVFGRAELDVAAFAAAFGVRFGGAAERRDVVLCAASRYLHALPAIADALALPLRARCCIAPTPSCGVVNAPLQRPAMTQCGRPLPPAFLPDAPAAALASAATCASSSAMEGAAEGGSAVAVAVAAAAPPPVLAAAPAAVAAATAAAPAPAAAAPAPMSAAPATTAAVAPAAPSPDAGGDVFAMLGGDASTDSDEAGPSIGGGFGGDIFGDDCSTESDEEGPSTGGRSSVPVVAPAAAAGAAAEDAEREERNAATSAAAAAAAATAAAAVEDICFVGRASDLQLVQLALEHPAHRIFIYNPESTDSSDSCSPTTIEPHSAVGNKLLMRRFYVVEKLKSANVIGVVMGTLGMAKYASAMRRALKLIAEAGKKSYTLVVGKVNVPKLCNFLEVDAFVLIADGETALALSGAAFGSKAEAEAEAVASGNTSTAALDFDKPIATLFELEVALNPERSWDGSYIADFRHIVASDESGATIGDDDEASAGGAPPSSRPKAEDGTLVAFGSREVGTAFYSPAATFLAEREWQGIEADLGGSTASVVTQGLVGIASTYESEPTTADAKVEAEAEEG